MQSVPQKKPVSQVKASDDAAGSIESTVGTFATRIARKLKEQEARADESSKAAEARHARMLQAMTTVRRALQDTSKIKLGGRFTLDLEVSDWEGWPRVQLDLVDSQIPDKRSHSLVITANDLKEQGTIRFSTGASTVLASIHLTEAPELERIPVILKRAVREFLDSVAVYILNPAKPEEEIRSINLNEEVDEIGEALKNEDVFTEESISDSNRADTASDAGPFVKL